MRETVAVFRYEYLMQIRRPGLWVSLIVLVGLFLLFGVENAPKLAAQVTNDPWQLGAAIMFDMNLLAPVAAGILVADRFPRDRLTGMSELISSSLPSRWALVFGKYLGSLLAVLTVPLLVLLLAMIAIAFEIHQASFILTTPVALLACMLPAWMFAVVWSLALPLVMRLRLYQVLFAGFWMWSVAVPRSRLPTINQTILSVNGEYARQAFFFHDSGMRYLLPPATTGWAIFNVCLIVALTIGGLMAMEIVLRKQERA